MSELLRADDLETIEKYSDAVYRMAYSLVKNKYDADDIHQEVFAIYIVKRPKFENAAHEKSWFMRVTVNLCKNLYKTAWRRKVVSLGDGFEETADAAKNVEVVETVETAEAMEDYGIIEVVKKLPFKYRSVIHLFYYEELSIKEIADILKIKSSTVRTHLTRARAKLKELLEKNNQ